MNSWALRKDELQAKLRKIEPRVVLMTKDNWFARLLAVIVSLFIEKETFLKWFATTIGHIIFIPKEYSYERAFRVCLHEVRHVTQFRWCGFGIHPMAGVPLMGIIWGLFPIPLGLAYGRFWLERDAEVFRLRLMLKEGYSISYIIDRGRSFADTLCSKAYGWPWPARWGVKSVRDKVDAMLTKEIRVV